MAKKRRTLDAAWAAKQYANGMTLKQIATQAGVHLETIRRLLISCGEDRRGASEAQVTWKVWNSGRLKLTGRSREEIIRALMDLPFTVGGERAVVIDANVRDILVRSLKGE